MLTGAHSAHPQGPPSAALPRTALRSGVPRAHGSSHVQANPVCRSPSSLKRLKSPAASKDLSNRSSAASWTAGQTYDCQARPGAGHQPWPTVRHLLHWPRPRTLGDGAISPGPRGTGPIVSTSTYGLPSRYPSPASDRSRARLRTGAGRHRGFSPGEIPVKTRKTSGYITRLTACGPAGSSAAALLRPSVLAARRVVARPLGADRWTAVPRGPAQG